MLGAEPEVAAVLDDVGVEAGEDVEGGMLLAALGLEVGDEAGEGRERRVGALVETFGHFPRGVEDY